MTDADADADRLPALNRLGHAGHSNRCLQGLPSSLVEFDSSRCVRDVRGRGRGEGHTRGALTNAQDGRGLLLPRDTGPVRPRRRQGQPDGQRGLARLDMGTTSQCVPSPLPLPLPHPPRTRSHVCGHHHRPRRRSQRARTGPGSAQARSRRPTSPRRRRRAYHLSVRVSICPSRMPEPLLSPPYIPPPLARARTCTPRARRRTSS